MVNIACEHLCISLFLCVQGGMCSVYIPVEDKVVNIACEHLEPVQPEKLDKVCSAQVPVVYSHEPTRPTLPSVSPP